MHSTISALLIASILATGLAAQRGGDGANASSPVPLDVSLRGLDERVAPRGESYGFLDGTSLDCVERIADRATGDCLAASSVPTSGVLFPYPGTNNAFAAPAFVGGGEGNTASGSHTAIGGGYRNATGGNFCAIGGGRTNFAGGRATTVGGGSANTAAGDGATIGGGEGNSTSAFAGVVAGGYRNATTGSRATVGGGFGNTASATNATIAGGSYNRVSGLGATIGGGDRNTASGEYATVGAGRANTASGDHSTVPGGVSNTALGRTSLAAGRRAKANHRGAFVWGDGEGGIDKPSSADDEFTVYCRGGARFFSDGGAATAGVTLAPGAGSWSSVSDRASKENVEPVNVRAVLERLSEIPMATWNYNAQEDSIRHMGPMAQDFHEAFGLGASERAIDTIDADGVALAAIQGLCELVNGNEQRLAEKEAEIEELRARLERMEALVGVTLADRERPPAPAAGPSRARR